MTRTSFALAFTLVAVLIGACASHPAGGGSPVKDDVPAAANAHGRYSDLLAKVDVPEDATTYGEFNDWGFWPGTSWAGHDNLPQGHWVYVRPTWYIWGRDNRPEDTGPVRIYGEALEAPRRRVPVGTATR